MEKKKILLISIVVVAAVGVTCLGIGIYKASANGKNIVDDEKIGENEVSVDKSLVQGNVVINADGIKENVNENVISPVEIEEFVLKNISLKYEEGITKFEATVVNNSETNYNEGTMFNVYFYDDAGNTLIMVPTTTSSLPAKGESYINAGMTMDYTNAASIKVELAK